MIQFVYFDLDDTLLDHHHAQEQALVETHQHFQAHFPHISLETMHDVYHEINVRLWQQYSDGQVSKQELNFRRFAETLKRLDVQNVDSVAFGAFYLEKYAAHWQWIDGAKEAFFQIAQKFPVGIVTNGFVEIQRNKFARFPDLESVCSVTMVSEEFGVMKPHPKLFAAAAEKAGFMPHEILYVGDSWHSDIQGGMSAGFQVAWFHRHPQTPKEHIFSFTHWQDLLIRLGVA